uniref:HD domain class transcription factor n=1 Tax=Solanum tuberosum TaxID=4113 RepID=M1D8K1_SOLTU
MEDHTDMSERRETMVNLMLRGPREDQNEDNFFTNNRDGGASGDELNSPHGFSSKRHKYSVNQIQELEASLDGCGEILNIEEYARSFIPIIGIKPSHFTTEATRSFGIVAGNSLTLVEMLMNDGDDIIANQNSMLIFQDNCTDATGSLLVYAIVDSSKMNIVMKGGGGLFLCETLAKWNFDSVTPRAYTLSGTGTREPLLAPNESLVWLT